MLTTFPLDGLSLIEASAGTGKTYAVANLYLRYLLEKQFTVDQILVVTFTEAATQELKDRIRCRIRDLREVFDAGNASSIDELSFDPLLVELYARSTDKILDSLRLKIAERQMDLAEIHTIHGFCQRVLKSHALDINTPLQQSLLEDQNSLHQKVIEDFWRQEILSLDEEQINYICSCWAAPEELLSSIRPLLNRRPKQIIPSIKDNGIFGWQTSYVESKVWFETLKNETLQNASDLRELIEKSDLKRLKDKLKWLERILVWSANQTQDFTFPQAGKRKNLFREFLPENLLAQTKAKGQAPEHGYFDFLQRHLATLPMSLSSQFVVQSYPLVADMIEREKRVLSVFGFDDLILRLESALRTDRAADIRQKIKAKFRVAMIDEFQDTDQSQYHIFSALFGVDADQTGVSNESGLVLIGDPKQAIYSFRGGDISTYLKAKKEISQHRRGNVYTMDTNWRSSPEMVSAVNAVFSGLQNPFKAQDIPFVSVKAANESDGRDQGAALCISMLSSEGLKKEQMTYALAEQCVRQVTRQLQQTGVKNSDIAILVRSGSEADIIKRQLAGVGLVASYESKSSIFESAEAQAIYFLLKAAADPRDEYAIKRCLAEPLFLVRDKTFAQFMAASEALDSYLSLFDSLNTRWKKSGVLATIREALAILGVFSEWGAGRTEISQSITSKSVTSQHSRDWERCLSNINQLAELLQKQSRTYRSKSSLIRWLRDSISGEMTTDDESKLRLESDEQLIRIVTIHKSKGLEYPYVFIPFLFSGRGVDGAWFYQHDIGSKENQLTLDLSDSDEHLDKADDERLAEDVRLLYVALTRAKYRCFVGTAAYKGVSKKSLGLAKTAWAYLLFQGDVPDKIDDEILTDCLDTFASRFSDLVDIEQLHIDDYQGVNCELDGAASLSRLDDTDESTMKKLSVNVLSRRIKSHWRVQSFTGLMQENHLQNRSIGIVPRASTKELDDTNIFSFPKGSKAGTFLHTLFESVVFETSEPIPALQTYYSGLEDLIRHKLTLSTLVDEQNVPVWSRYLVTWVKSVLKFKLPLNNHDVSSDLFSLSDLKEKDYVSEMSFYFSVGRLRMNEFNRLLTDYGCTAPDISFSHFEGHLKGAIDLVFKANEQFFILDYKSNYLGDTTEDYQVEVLHAAMEDHRYDVQYILYTLATHRYLKHRLGDSYCYQRDFGGVYYLFLRGLALVSPKIMPQTASTGVWFIKPEFELIDALDRQVASL